MQPQRLPRRFSPLKRTLLLLGLMLLGGQQARAQTWVALTPGSPPGTPATLALSPLGSNYEITRLSLDLHGYWVETVIGGNGLSYQRYDFPGLGRIDQIGAPELPALRPTIALASGASQVLLTSATIAPNDILFLTTRVYPQPIPSLDSEDPGQGDLDGSPEVFQVDGTIYGSAGLWPAQDASASAPSRTILGGANGAEVELFPVRFDPAGNRLRIAKKTLYTFNHFGPALNQTVSRDTSKLLTALAINFPVLQAQFSVEGTVYRGRYLIVCSQALLGSLEPWIEHRRSMGFDTAILLRESLSSTTPLAFKNAIQSWYLAGDPRAEHYCLLVGDETVIPQGPSPFAGLLSDDYYADPLLGSATDRIYVGRWPSRKPSEITQVIQHSLAYELDQDLTHDYSKVLLVSHKATKPTDFAAALGLVSSANYAVPLAFEAFKGALATNTDDALLAKVNGGLGLIAYRGHGSQNSWYDFGAAGGDLGTLHKDELKALTTTQPPVVWSFSCNNNLLLPSGSLGHSWLTAEHGAVAHYGSGANIRSDANDRLALSLFKAAFGSGVRTQGMAIALAEEQLHAALPNAPSPWAYSLFGCPAMKLRAAIPRPLDLTLPATVQTCTPVAGGPPCPNLSIFVFGAGSSTPLPGIQVSIYKQNFNPALGIELAYSTYTTPNGPAVVPGPQSLAAINTTGRDDDGNVAKEFAQAKSGAFVKLGDGTIGSNGVPRLLSESDLSPSAALLLRLEDGRPGSYSITAGSLSQSPLPIYGGLLYPGLPFLGTLDGVTDGLGNLNFNIPVWPPMFPSGLHVYFQSAVLDPQAIEGVALTNALDGLSP